MTEVLTNTCAIVILAAGQSSRMRGQDKLLEEVCGVPLLRQIVDKARAASDAPIYVTLPPSPHARHAAIAECDVRCVEIADATLGMSASLRGALDELPKHCKVAMVLLADMPNLTSNDIAEVLAAVDLNSSDLIWRGATEDGVAGHPVVFSSTLFDRLIQLDGDQGGAEVIKAHQEQTKLVPLPNDHARRDLDTPEDWAAWRKETNA